MRAISLFSGVGGFDLGLERAGIETVLQCEIDPWCREVLARHWPGVRRVDDVRSVFRDTVCPERTGSASGSGERAESGSGTDGEGRRGPDGIDLVYGGFPCQPFSVAGQRRGDRDERNLWPEFRRVVRELRPSWVLAENVPGILSFDDGRFFGSILDDLGKLGFEGVAYAVLDARYFGVAQRRRRVFVVAGPGVGSVASILSICESCGGNPETSRAPGQGLAATIRGRSAGRGVNMPGRGGEDDANLVMAVSDNIDGHVYTSDTAFALQSSNQRPQAVFAAVSASAGHRGHSSSRGDGSDNLVLANPLGSNQTGGFRFDLDGDTYIPDIAYTIAAREAKGVSLLESQTNYIAQNGVRRLTPLECERLQGWPDDHTRWTANGREISDSVRYRMIGNGVVAPVAEWIGRRIVAMEKARLAAGLGDGAE